MMNITPQYVLPTGGFEGPDSGFVAKIRDFTEHILYKKPTIIAAEHGLMVQQMLNAIYDSAAKGGKEVAIR